MGFQRIKRVWGRVHTHMHTHIHVHTHVHACTRICTLMFTVLHHNQTACCDFVWTYMKTPLEISALPYGCSRTFSVESWSLEVEGRHGESVKPKLNLDVCYRATQQWCFKDPELGQLNKVRPEGLISAFTDQRNIKCQTRAPKCRLWFQEGPVNNWERTWSKDSVVTRLQKWVRARRCGDK